MSTTEPHIIQAISKSHHPPVTEPPQATKPAVATGAASLSVLIIPPGVGLDRGFGIRVARRLQLAVEGEVEQPVERFSCVRCRWLGKLCTWGRLIWVHGDELIVPASSRMYEPEDQGLKAVPLFAAS